MAETIHVTLADEKLIDTRLTQGQKDSIVALMEYTEDENYPTICNPLPDEMPYYDLFLIYLALGPTRRVMTVANVVRPENLQQIEAGQIGSKTTVKGSQEYNPVANKVYKHITHVAVNFSWRMRAEAFDRFIAQRILARTAHKLIMYGNDALDRLHLEMNTAGNANTRVSAAKALIDKVIPTVSESTIIRKDKTPIELTDDELFEIAKPETKTALNDRQRLLAELPPPPVLEKNDFIDAKFVEQQIPAPTQEEIDQLAKSMDSLLGADSEESSTNDHQ